MLVKRKYNVGRVTAGMQQWIFGIFDCEKRIGVIEFVTDRSSATLIPIIKKYCLEGDLDCFFNIFLLLGTVIWSDEWSAYKCLSNESFVHRTVNHSRNFKDPVSGVNTNLIESFWAQCKRKFKSMSGTRASFCSSYVDAFLWRQYNGKSTSAAFENLLGQLGTLWPWDEESEKNTESTSYEKQRE